MIWFFDFVVDSSTLWHVQRWLEVILAALYYTSVSSAVIFVQPTDYGSVHYFIINNLYLHVLSSSYLGLDLTCPFIILLTPSF